MARFKNSCASWVVYGCGKRSRTPSQILRLFACLAIDSASSTRHGRMVHCCSVSFIPFLVDESDARTRAHSESLREMPSALQSILREVLWSAMRPRIALATLVSKVSLSFELNTRVLHLAIR